MEDLSLKHRPRSFSRLLQPIIAKALRNAVVGDRVSHCYMFSGPKGCGKTSSARILAMALDCPDREKDGEPCGKCESCTSIMEGSCPDVMEINAAQQRGIDDMWNLIASTINHPPMVSPRKVYILDECHMLTPQAQNSLLKSLEEPPEYVNFILCTTEPRKVLPTIADRSQHFQFGFVSTDVIFERLSEVCDAEGIKIESDALKEISRSSNGSMRMGYKLIDKVRSSDTVTLEEVREILGKTASAAAIEILDMISSHKRGSALRMIDDLNSGGKDLLELFRECLSAMSDIIRVRLSGSESITSRSDDEIKRMTIIDDRLNGKQMEGMYDVFRQAIIDLSSTAIPKDIVAMMAVVSAIRLHEEGGAK